jgi:hypothetical protein
MGILEVVSKIILKGEESFEDISVAVALYLECSCLQVRTAVVSRAKHELSNPGHYRKRRQCVPVHELHERVLHSSETG